MKQELDYEIRKVSNQLEITLKIHNVSDNVHGSLARKIIYGGFLHEEGYEFDVTEGNYPDIIVIFKSKEEITEEQLLAIKKKFEKKYLALEEPVSGYARLIRRVMLEQLVQNDAIEKAIRSHIEKATESNFHRFEKAQELIVKEIKNIKCTIENQEATQKNEIPIPPPIRKMVSFRERFMKCWNCISQDKKNKDSLPY